MFEDINLLTYGSNHNNKKALREYSKPEVVAFGIFSKFDTEAPNSQYGGDTKITKDEFKNVKKEDYDKYIKDLKKEMKTEEGMDLSEVKIPSYEEIEKKLDKGDLNLDEFLKSLETSEKKTPVNDTLSNNNNVSEDKTPEKYSNKFKQANEKIEKGREIESEGLKEQKEVMESFKSKFRALSLVGKVNEAKQIYEQLKQVDPNLPDTYEEFMEPKSSVEISK